MTEIALTAQLVLLSHEVAAMGNEVTCAYERWLGALREDGTESKPYAYGQQAEAEAKDDPDGGRRDIEGPERAGLYEARYHLLSEQQTLLYATRASLVKALAGVLTSSNGGYGHSSGYGHH